MVKHSSMMVLLILIAVIAGAPLLSPVLSEVMEPLSSGECEECHTEFEPFRVQSDSPSEVPLDNEFEAGVLIENPWTHELTDVVVELDISSMPFIEFAEMAEVEDQELSMEGSVPGGGRTTHEIEVSSHCVGLTIDLSWQRPLLYLGDVDLTLIGPNEGSWSSNTDGTTETIQLSQEDIASEGHGTFTVYVESGASVRSVDYSLTALVDNLASPGVSQIRIDGIGSMEEQRVKFRLRSIGKGEGTIEYRIMANAHHTHDGRGADDDMYDESGTFNIVVGDSYIYSKATSSIGALEGLWIMGRIFGFISVTLYLASFLTGGVSKRLKTLFTSRVKKARQWHCVISFGALISVIVHLTVLYSGVYSGTWKGIYLGGAALFLMAVVALTGIFRESLVGSMGERRWRRLHYWSSLAIILLFVVHAVLEGTDLAFLRVW